MAKEVLYKSWKFFVDFDRTKEVYKQIKKGSPETCNCNHCKNFSANREVIYPTSFKKILNELGVNYKKEVEVYHMGKLENEKHFYGGWFHFKGKIINEDISIPTNNYYTILINKNFKVKISQSSSLSFFKEEEYTDLIQMEFFAASDWVIDKPFQQ